MTSKLFVAVTFAALMLLLFPGISTDINDAFAVLPLEDTTDSDGDGLTDIEERLHETNPNHTDTDGDGLWDGDEIKHTANPRDGDTDNDYLLDGDEVHVHKTDPRNSDTDGDGFWDGHEVHGFGTDPFDEDDFPIGPDTDGDGLLDFLEVERADRWATHPSTHRMDITNPDSDGDGLTDGEEVYVHGTKPDHWDTDHDGLSDGDEVHEHDTDPLERDTDGDGFFDAEELHEYDTDPTDRNSFSQEVYDRLTEFYGTTDSQHLCTPSIMVNINNDYEIMGKPPDFNLRHLEGMIGEIVECSHSTYDSDGDRLTDIQEQGFGWGSEPTDRSNPDTDRDGLWDGDEVNWYETDPRNFDTDGDGWIDGHEVHTSGTDPTNPDNAEPLPDDFSRLHGMLGTMDSESLCFLFANSFGNHWIINQEDTSDYSQISARDYYILSGFIGELEVCIPPSTDQDFDGLSDDEELLWRTFLVNPDSDKDGIFDGEEVHVHGTSPRIDDSDFDGLNDFAEIHVHGTSPMNTDSDGGGISDGTEISQGTDPLDADDDPDNGNGAPPVPVSSTFQSSVTVKGAIGESQQTITSVVMILAEEDSEPDPKPEPKPIKRGGGSSGGGGNVFSSTSTTRANIMDEIYHPYLNRVLGNNGPTLSHQVFLAMFGISADSMPHWNNEAIQWVLDGKLSLTDLEESLKWQYDNNLIK